MDKFVKQRQLEIQENILKSVTGVQMSGNKGYPVGTVRWWNGKRYKKKINGDWVYSPEKKDERGEGDELPLNDKHKEVIESYSNRKYQSINNALRHGETKDRGLKVDIYNLREALDRLPVHNDDVYRGMTMGGYSLDQIYNEYSNAMEENDTLEFDAFLSTTKNREIVEEFTGKQWDKGVIFNIKTDQDSKARDVSEYTVIPSEEEVIFKPNSQFEIVNIDKDEDQGVVEVDLKEI